jgi:2'-5' RNA ligase
MGEKIRTFIAIDLPDPVRQAISKTQEKLRRTGLGIRWVRPQGIHLTLKFLGDIEKSDVEKVHGAMKEAVQSTSPFSLRGEGLGVFPDFKRPRVLWIGVAGDLETLRALQRDLDFQLKGLGFPREKRAFKGHLTLGRAKGRLDGNQLRRALQRYEDFSTDPFTAECLTFFQSDLRPTGAVYTKLAEVGFEG